MATAALAALGWYGWFFCLPKIYHGPEFVLVENKKECKKTFSPPKMNYL
jgi:hypothetical protein